MFFFFFFLIHVFIFYFLLFADGIRSVAYKEHGPSQLPVDESEYENSNSENSFPSKKVSINKKRKISVLSDDDDFENKRKKTMISTDSDYFIDGAETEEQLNANNKIADQSQIVKITSPDTVNKSTVAISPIKESSPKISNNKPRLCKEKKVSLPAVNKKKHNSAVVKLTQMAKCNRSPLGEVLSNPKEYEISNVGGKKYACPYCSKIYSDKLVDHLIAKHKNEPKVIEIMRLPPARRIKGQPLNEHQLKRQKLLNEIKNDGAFKFNCKLKTGKFQPVRRPQGDRVKKISDYRACPFCNGFYMKNSIRKHLPRCSGSEYYKAIQSKTMHNYVIGDVHPDASVYLRIVLSRLRDDDISKIAKNDMLIIIYGNFEAFKFKHSNHHNKQIRAELRLLARILIQMKKIHDKITDFASMLNPDYSKAYIETADALGRFNPSTGLFDAPATARDVGRIVAAVCDVWIAECYERRKALPSEVKENAEGFLHLHRVRFPKLISKTVAESQTQMSINSGLTKLPSRSDIKILRNYIVKERDSDFQKLENNFNFNTWRRLAQSTLLSILIFNRKRPGEISRLYIKSYENSKCAIDANTNPEFYAKISDVAKELASKYMRILTRGKKNAKISPILLDPKMVSCLELILKYRLEAGVPEDNPYVFGLPSRNNEHFWVEASPLLAQYAQQCGAEIPSLLRGTPLRKHIATIGVALNLTDGQIDNLSTFMGHDKNIHLNIYRQPVASQDILNVAQWLEYAQGDFVETDRGHILFEDESTSDLEMEEGSDDDDTNDYDELIPKIRKSVKRKESEASTSKCTDNGKLYCILK